MSDGGGGGGESDAGKGGGQGGGGPDYTPSYDPGTSPSYDPGPSPSYYDPGSGGGFDLTGSEGPGGDLLPPGATTTGGTAPFSWESLNYSAPAGTSGTPDIGALNAINATFPGSNALAMATPTTGPSAGGGVALGAGGGSSDLSAGGWDESFLRAGFTDPTRGLNPSSDPYGSNPQTPYDIHNPTYGENNGLPGYGESPPLGAGGSSSADGGGGDKSWKDSFKVSNPLSTAIAAGGLANALINGQNPSGTERQLAEIARQNQASSANLTNTGSQFAGQGNADLRARAASTDPNATTLMDRGTGLTAYAGTGTLPASVQAQLDQAKSDARAQLVSKYAARGMPVDPARNSSLRAELQDLDRRTIAQGETMAAELAKTGSGLLTTGAGLNQTSGNFENNAAQLGTQLVSSGVSQSGIAGTTYAKLAELDAARNKRTSDAISAMAAALSGTSNRPKITIG